MGERESLGGLGLHDHACWRVHGARWFPDAVRPFLSDGLRLGAKCVVVTSGRADHVLDALGPIGRQVEFWSLDAMYGRDEPVRPTETVAAYDDATSRSIREGYTGLRVAADISSLVRTDAQRVAFAEYEVLVDRLMQRAPMSAVCSCGADEVDAVAAMALAAIHPVRALDTSPFSLRLEHDGTVRLEGEVDRFQREALIAALSGVREMVAGGSTTVDVTGLEFVDHRTLLDLDRAAADREHRLVLTGAGQVLARLVGLIDLRATSVLRVGERS
ncbi:MAG: MEDS domain-containing protein [Acidimicrobiales bacterium]